METEKRQRETYTHFRELSMTQNAQNKLDAEKDKESEIK